MYAIQKPNGKFINPKYYFDSEVVDITVSAKAKTYATLEEATAVMQSITAFLSKAITQRSFLLERNKNAMRAAETKIAKANAKIAELEVLPYKDVVKKIGAAIREKGRAESDITILKTSIASQQQYISNLKRLENEGFAVVELVMTAVAT